MAQQFFHLRDVKDLRVVSDDEGGYMLKVVVKDGAQPSEPCGLLDNFVSMSVRGYGFPPCFGYNLDIIAAVDSPLSSLEDTVEFFERNYKS